MLYQFSRESRDDGYGYQDLHYIDQPCLCDFIIGYQECNYRMYKSPNSLEL